MGPISQDRGEEALGPNFRLFGTWEKSLSDQPSNGGEKECARDPDQSELPTQYPDLHR